MSRKWLRKVCSVISSSKDATSYPTIYTFQLLLATATPQLELLLRTSSPEWDCPPPPKKVHGLRLIKRGHTDPTADCPFDTDELHSCPMAAYHMVQQTNPGSDRCGFKSSFPSSLTWHLWVPVFFVCNVPIVIFMSCLWRLKEIKCAKYLKKLSGTK